MFHTLRAFLLAGILCFATGTVAAQDPASVEELIEQYEEGNFAKNELSVLKEIA